MPQQDGRVAHRLGDRPGLVERGGEGDDAPARAAPVGRLDADGAGEGRRLADRAAGVGGRGAEAQVGRHRRRRAARRAARHQRDVGALAPPGIDHRPEAARLVRRAHGELVAVELAQHHRARIPQVLRHGRLVGRRELVEDVGAGRGAHALGAVQVLDAERQAFERPRLALGEPRVAGLGLRQRDLRRRQHVGVERLVAGLDGIEERLRQLGGGELLRAQPVARLGQRQFGEIGHVAFRPLSSRSASAPGPRHPRSPAPAVPMDPASTRDRDDTQLTPPPSARRRNRPRARARWRAPRRRSRRRSPCPRASSASSASRASSARRWRRRPRRVA